MKIHGRHNDLKDDKHDKPLKLSNIALKPFETPSDWSTEDGEIIVTIKTISQQLYDQWELQAVNTNSYKNLAEIDGRPAAKDQYVRVYTHKVFENDFRGPGVYLDDTNYDDSNKFDECYTIIIPDNFAPKEKQKSYIQRLNEKFGRQLRLEDDDKMKERLDLTTGSIKKDLEDPPENLRELVKLFYEKKV